jgi:hypothetical protein
VLDELNHLNVEFVSFREQIDTGGPLGRAIVVIIGAIAELERNLIVERVRAGMRTGSPFRPLLAEWGEGAPASKAARSDAPHSRSTAGPYGATVQRA